MLDCTLATGAAHALAALVQLVSAEFSSSAVTMRFFSDSSSSHGLELRVINDAATSFFKLRMHDTAFRQFSIDSPTGLVDVSALLRTPWGLLQLFSLSALAPPQP
eukprot:tig00020816_g14178.t1